MQCFQHPHQGAVGICKYCHKGLCSDCAYDTSYGLGCAQHHTNELATLHAIYQMHQRSLWHSRRLMRGLALFLLLTGIVFVVQGIALAPRTYFTLIYGIIALLFAGLSYLFSRRVGVLKGTS